MIGVYIFCSPLKGRSISHPTSTTNLLVLSRESRMNIFLRTRKSIPFSEYLDFQQAREPISDNTSLYNQSLWNPLGGSRHTLKCMAPTYVRAAHRSHLAQHFYHAVIDKLLLICALQQRHGIFTNL